MNLLADYMIAKQIKKSVRAVQRMAERGDLKIGHVGKTPYVFLPSFRETLHASMTKVDAA
jgi:hypothetical protein